VLKEFPARYRGALSSLQRHGFARIPSFPNVRLRLEYADFDDFCRRRLSGSVRAKLKRKIRDAAAHPPPIVMQPVTDIAPYIDEVYPLYLQVYQKSAFKFELLTPDFILGLADRMPDKVRFFIWRQQGKAIGFAICMIEADALYGEYMGLDYSVAEKVHTYFIIMRDLMDWAIHAGFRYFCSTGLNYEPKYHFRFDLEPLDLYVTHTSAITNWFLRRLIYLIEPTHHDPILRRFENYEDLWTDAARGRPH
jgi:predicted N-acyltransferase